MPIPLHREDQVNYSVELDKLRRKPRVLNGDLAPLRFERSYYSFFDRTLRPFLWSGISLEVFFDKISEIREEDDSLILSHIHRLTLSLILFSKIQSPNGPAFDIRLYIEYSLRYGPEFANWLKDVRQAMMIHSLSTRKIKDNESFIAEVRNNRYGIVLDKPRYDYDSFLNEQYLIPFTEEANDFEWAFRPISVNEQWYDNFRSAAKCLFNDFKLERVHQPSQDVLATWITDSVTISDNKPILNRSLMRDLSAKGELLQLYEDSRKSGFNFKRSSVFVGPANARDTWQCDLPSLFKVKRIAELLKQVCDRLPNSAMASSDKAWKRRRELRKASNFLMFDYKKCGLTVNRRLLVIIGEELDRIYPGSGFSELCHFEHVNVMNGEILHKPIRGVGLGNCNEGITLIQCVIGYMLSQAFKINSIFFNDDGVFWSEGEVYIPFSRIYSGISNLGMIINLKKTMISDCNVFCEDYYIHDREIISYSKTQSIILPFANVWFKPTIAGAKSLYYDLERGLIGRGVNVKAFIPSIYRWWGFEFHKSEYWWPFEFGGWQYYGDTNINECLNLLFDTRPYIDRHQAIDLELFRTWTAYLFSHQEIGKMLRGKGNISYNTFVPNPFIRKEYNSGQSELVLRICRELALQTLKDRKDQLNDLYNKRGMKNAKPRIKLGSEKKLLSHRMSIWRKYKQSVDMYSERVKSTEAWVFRAVHYIRENEVTPMMYSIPPFLIEDS